MPIKSLRKAYEENFLRGYQEGYQESKLEGLREVQLTVAAKMLLEGFDIALIAKITKLTVADIEQLEPHKIA